MRGENSMKILAISCGQKDGNNDSMCKEALMVAKEMGAEVEFIRAMDLDIRHCTGCVVCSISLVHGKGNRCSVKDDMDWLINKMYDADGIFWSVPIFEKTTAGIFHNICDRMGPRMDKGNNLVATKIAEQTGGIIPDPRYLKDRAVAFIGIGGSDWCTRVQCSMGMLAMTTMWKVVANEVFPWSKGIILEEEKIGKVRRIARDLVEAARDIEHAEYKGDPGVCPHCHSHNFYLKPNSDEAICCLCGIVGKLKIENGKTSFSFPEEQLEHAHDTIPGKLKHADDIRKNEEGMIAIKKTDIYKEKLKTYKEFITASRPDR
jgi:multimeric flavodoxin WrbA